MKKNFKFVIYTHVSFIISLFVISGIGIFNGTINPFLFLILFFFVSYVLTSAGLHRYFTHSSYKLGKVRHKILSYLSCLALLGSPIQYATVHLSHHANSDTEKDPHSPIIGVLRLIFLVYDFDKTDQHVPIKLLRDRFNIALHNNYHLILAITFFIIGIINFTLLTTLSLAIVANLISIGFFNYFQHSKFIFNYRNFETKDNSQNNLIFLFLNGDLHNNHHRYPGLSNQSFKKFEFDIVGKFIDLIKNKDDNKKAEIQI